MPRLLEEEAEAQELYPQIAAAMTMAMFEALNTRLRNIFRSITGTAARLVLTTKATAAATATTQLPMILADPHPQEGPLSKPREMAPMVTTIMRLPKRSGIRVVRSWRTLGIIFQVTRTATMPIGTLMTKIHRQLERGEQPSDYRADGAGCCAAHRPH